MILFLLSSVLFTSDLLSSNLIKRSILICCISSFLASLIKMNFLPMLHEKKYPSAIVTFDHSYSSSNFTLRRISFINNINNSIFVPFGAEKKIIIMVMVMVIISIELLGC